MINTRVFLLSAVSLAITGILSQPDAKETLKNNELIVTASKQSQYAASSQNVASYNASGRRLEDANITNSKDLKKILPGLLIIEKSDTLFMPSVSMRGASQGQDFYSPAIQLYIDGIPQSSLAFIQPLNNVENVQLLKGPQATLYGKYATGGIIDIITQKPDADYHGYISGGYALGNGYRGGFNISGPITDGILYGSISGLRESEPGTMTNPGTGHKHLGGSTDNIGSVRLRLAPDNQPLELNAAYTGQCVDSTQGMPMHVLDHNPAKTDGFANSDVTGSAPDPKMRRCIHSQSLTGQYNTNHWLFIGVTAWNQLRLDQYGPLPGGGLYHLPERLLENTLEFRAATQGAGNTIDALIGLYRHDARRYSGMNSLRNDFSPNPEAVREALDIKKQSVAVYTDLTWHATQQLDFGAGVRFSHDNEKTILFRKIAGHANISDNSVLGQVSLGYQITPQNRIYARIAQSYKPGGYDYTNMTADGEMKAYKPEKSISYEIGNKYQNDRFHLQSDVFYTDTTRLIDNVQIEPWVFALTNLGNVQAYGAEITGSYYFTAGWEVGANASVVHSKFTDDVKNNAAYANRRVPSVPNYSVGIYVNGSMNTPAGLITPYIGFNAVGSYTFGDYDFTQKAYTTTDIRVGWQVTDRINLSAYVNNLFDQRYFTFADIRFASYGQDYGYANIGRTAGLDLKIDLF